VLQALRLLREKPLYNIATIATEAGFSNVPTLQRRVQDVIGMSPVDYRVMLTRDIK
jgi:AraC-like DNA-binding protein